MRPTSRRLFAFGTGLAAAAAALPSARAAAAGEPGRNKVVFQVSDGDPSKWNLTLNNVRNFQTELPDDESDIEIVAYGPGIDMLKGGSSAAHRIAETLKHGVKVVACENSMRGQKLVYADMLPDIGFVPAGVVELVRKQQQGYAYIRA
ncbi:MAG TPA: DsrE family protein [Caldimonas sp.]|nr:DsrE family protein [Caldimonas sp.]